MDKKAYTLDFLRTLLDVGGVPDSSELEKAALCGEIPMTAELFSNCLDACAEAGNAIAYFELFERFPEIGRRWASELGRELEALDISQKATGKRNEKLSEERIREHWTAFKESVRNRFGDEIADNLADDILKI